jgi:hypothetical protein
MGKGGRKEKEGKKTEGKGREREGEEKRYLKAVSQIWTLKGPGLGPRLSPCGERLLTSWAFSGRKQMHICTNP